MPQDIRIIGVGSWHGADRVGWQMIDRLSETKRPGVQWHKVDHPTQVIDRAEGCDQLILVDASATGGTAGTVQRYSWPDPRFAAAPRHAAHGFGVVEVLTLLTQLGRLPRQVVIFGIEVGGDAAVSLDERILGEVFGTLKRLIGDEVDAAVNGVADEAVWQNRGEAG